MAEIHPSTPIQVTSHFEAAAAARGINALTVDETAFAAVLQITERTDLEGRAAFAIGASRRIGGDSIKGQLYDGHYIGKHRPATPEALGPKRNVIRLQVDQAEPITEAGLARRTAETLLVPARMRNTIRRAAGALSLAAGALCETVAFATYMADDGNFEPGTLTWAIGGAAFLVGGGAAIANGHKRGRQINTAEQRAAQLTPITAR